MCLGVWSMQGYVWDKDINEITALEKIVGEEKMKELLDWNIIEI